MKVSDLKPAFYLFGNKGTVWSDNAHIAKGSESVTLCGTPMLSTNWASINNLEHANCTKCNEIYNIVNAE